MYLQRTAFGGKVAGRNFGVSPSTGARFDVVRLASVLEDIHERLIETYDRPGTLFYLDPPYWGCETDYGDGVFGREDFEALAGQLAGIRGRFLLSLNDTAGVRRVFKGFEIEAVETHYSVNGGAQRRAAEVLISAKRRR